MKFYKKILKSSFPHTVIMGGLFLLGFGLYGEVLLNYIFSPIINSWDGQSHLSLNQVYFDTIYPNTFGWIQNWYAGMPFPQFYPPLFYFTTSTLSFITGIELKYVFKTFVALLPLIFPVIVYSSTYKISRAIPVSLAVGLSMILFLGIPDVMGGGLGMTLAATINSGLVTQSLALIFFIIWLGFATTKNNFEIQRNIPEIFFATLILLTNAHVAQAIILITIGIFAYELFSFKNRKTILFFYIKYSALVGLLVSFWYFPLFKFYQYSTTKTMSSAVEFTSYPTWLYILMFTFLLMGITVLVKENKNYALGRLVAAACIGLLWFIPISSVLPSLPLQADRNIPIFLFITFMLGAWSFWHIGKEKLAGKYNFLVSSIPLLVIIPMIFTFAGTSNFLGSFPRQHSYEIAGIKSYLENKSDMRSSVDAYVSQIPFRIDQEVFIDQKQRFRTPGIESMLYGNTMELLPDHYIISALLGESTKHQTIWTVFRESSISSLFVQPLRNTFSYANEDFGTICYLCETPSKENLRKQDIKTKLAQAKIFNLGYFVVHEKGNKNWFQENQEYFEQVYQSYPWLVFKKREVTSFAHIPDSLPVLVFNELKTKDRPENGVSAYDWVRLNELWYEDGTLDPYLVHAGTTLDKITEPLSSFGSMVIINSDKKNIEKSAEIISDYSESTQRPVLVFNSNKELLDELSKNTLDNLIIINPKQDVYQTSSEIFNILENNRVPSTAALISEFSQEKNNISIQLSNKDSINSRVPVYLSNSYFPAWKSKDPNDSLFMVSPTMTLIFTNNSYINLQFKKTTPIAGVVLGVFISIYLLLKKK
jgi:hypothetical protein